MTLRFKAGVVLVAMMCAGCDDDGAQREELSDIEELELLADKLAVQTGCTSVDQCRTAPVGEKACGGPRYHLVYCAPQTDETQLQSVLNEVLEREQGYNQRYYPISTCRFVSPPEVELVGGVCLRKKT